MLTGLNISDIRKAPQMWGKWNRASLFGERAAILELELLSIAHRHLRIAAAWYVVLHDVVAYGDLPVTAVRHGIVCAIGSGSMSLPTCHTPSEALVLLALST